MKCLWEEDDILLYLFIIKNGQICLDFDLLSPDLLWGSLLALNGLDQSIQPGIKLVTGWWVEVFWNILYPSRSTEIPKSVEYLYFLWKYRYSTNLGISEDTLFHTRTHSGFPLWWTLQRKCEVFWNTELRERGTWLGPSCWAQGPLLTTDTRVIGMTDNTGHHLTRDWKVG